jgi:hypothetical protein
MPRISADAVSADVTPCCGAPYLGRRYPCMHVWVAARVDHAPIESILAERSRPPQLELEDPGAYAHPDQLTLSL